MILNSQKKKFMVTINLQGGLGNQLFQQCCLVAYALRNNLEYVIPTEASNGHGTGAYRFKGFNYSDDTPTFPTYTEPHFHFRPIPFMDNVCLNGYFQSQYYFEDYIDEIREMIGLEYKEEKGVCAIHVRRGDYLTLPDYHPFVGEEYLDEAMWEMCSLANPNKFKIFSDDMDWCKKFFSRYGVEIEYADGNNEVEDLRQGACCEHQIISNSTFSLWQHILNRNPNKICIAPKRWFGHAAGDIETRDLYPSKNCIKL